jgi:hypothetical protein
LSTKITVTALNRQTKKKKLEKMKHERRPSLTLSDSGNDMVTRRESLATTDLFTQFARRPSWIAGESGSSLESEFNAALAFTPRGVSSTVADATGNGLATTSMDSADSAQANSTSVPDIERRPSSWHFLNQFDTLLAQELAEMGDTTTGGGDGIGAPPPLPPVEENNSNNDIDNPSNNYSGSDRFSALIKESFKTWDPRSSNFSQDSILPARRSAILRDPMRTSGQTSLRRATNSMRLSDISMAAAEFLQDVDWGASESLYE